MILWAYGVVVRMFDFHRGDRGSNPGRGDEFHNDKRYTLVPSVNPTCHPSEVGKWVTVKLLGSNWETQGNGVAPSPTTW